MKTGQIVRFMEPVHHGGQTDTSFNLILRRCRVKKIGRDIQQWILLITIKKITFRNQVNIITQQS